jgi:hypothetical protein
LRHLLAESPAGRRAWPAQAGLHAQLHAPISGQQEEDSADCRSGVLAMSDLDEKRELEALA